MVKAFIGAGWVGGRELSRLLLLLVGCGWHLSALVGEAQERESLAGETAAQALKESALAEAGRYNIRYGPVDLRVGAGVHFGYTDNAFYSQTNRLADFLVNPEVDLGAFMQVSEVNTLKASLGIGYEYYAKNSVLNGNAPLVNPDSELQFNLFIGDFHIRLHEKYSYQQTLFINTSLSGQEILFNFNNVGIFSRWDNRVGFDADWDLRKVIVSVGYDHENFVSTTASYDYLTRASEWFPASIAFLLGDQVRLGLEGRGSLQNYDSETVLNDHWRARGGPFVDLKLKEGINFRAGGGYDTAQYDAAGAGSDFRTYYAYGRLSQETRVFSHAISAGRESGLGDNSNNLETTYVRYSISVPIVEHLDLEANGSVNFAREFGGAFSEKYTYYVAGVRASCQFHKYWRADVGYEFLLKESQLLFRDYYRDRVTLGLVFSF